MRSEKNESIAGYKVLFSVLIMFIYLIGRSIPLYGIDFAYYMDKDNITDELLLHTISGDIFQCSILTLGISPYMISNIIVQIISAFINSEKRSKMSPTKMAELTIVLAMIIAVLQAFLRVIDMKFAVKTEMLQIAPIIAFIQMVTGAIIIMWLQTKCKRFGIGGQAVFILINVIDSLRNTLFNYDIEKLTLPLIIVLFVILVTIILENAEKRIPVQRVSIHNIYADKNYMAIKMNPIGVMPAMFSTAFFMIPQLLISLLKILLPGNDNIIWCSENMVLTKPLGIATYVLILYILSIVFSRVFISPSNITEQYLKSGDSIVNLHAGKETKKYLSRTINRISIFSATLMAICLIIPIILNVYGIIDEGLVMFPSMAMMLTGLWCNLYREFKSIRNLEAYKPFI